MAEPTPDGGPELTFRAVALGVLLAAILGAANAYLGLKAGMTVSATFPAAVIAIAAFRLPFFRGGVLEQNITRTAATVGEALVAAAIFTLPAFVMVELNGQRLLTSFNYWESVGLLIILPREFPCAVPMSWTTRPPGPSTGTIDTRSRETEWISS